MLHRIAVQNLAIVSQTSIEFGQGMNVLTGETGCGKSILIEAIALLAGQKASSGDVRKGESQAYVEGTISLDSSSKAWEFLQDAGIIFDGNEVTIKRLIQSDGKSKAYINNQTWTNTGLTSFAEFWLDVTSQHAHQKLLDDVRHLEVIDEYAQLEALQKEYANVFSNLKKIISDLSDLERKKQKAKEEQDYWIFQLKELENLRLQDGELESLQSTFQRTANAQKLAEHIERIKSCLEGDQSISKQISLIGRELSSAIRMDASLENAFKEIEGAKVQIDEFSSFIHRYSQSLSHNPTEVEKINERISALQSVVRKYGSIASAIEKKEDIKNMLSLLDGSNEQEVKFLAEKKNLEKEVQTKAENLSKLRKKAAIELCKKITKEFQELGMKNAKIECNFEDSKPEQGTIISIGGRGYTSQGQESVYLNFSPNPGEGFRPLSAIASGGELSRILLAIKSIAIQDNASNDITFLFDEVDAGIGGETADRLGIRLSSLSSNGAQVLCVTHLAQIACYAKQHLLVQKNTQQKRTVTEVVLLNATERKKELARMIGGVEITDKVIAHATELLKKSHTVQTSF